MIRRRGKHYNLWQKARRKFVKLYPDQICAICDGFATDVDHIKKRSTHPQLRYVMENLQWLCRRCHTEKDQ